MHNIAIIPARAGSKRIPNKNIKLFHNKPIIAYSIATALESELFSEVMVSTDSELIADLAIEMGASVPFLRSTRNSDDHATTADVILEVIGQYAVKGQHYDYGCCIYPTAPFITEEKIKEGYDMLVSQNRDSVFPVTPFSAAYWRGFRRNEDGSIKMLWEKNQDKRSQDLEEVYHDAGQWYWFSVNAFQQKCKLFTDNTASLILDPFHAHDIDSLDDWHLAELKYAYIQSLK